MAKSIARKTSRKLKRSKKSVSKKSSKRTKRSSKRVSYRSYRMMPAARAAAAGQEDVNKLFHKAIYGGRGNDFAEIAKLVVEDGADINSRGHRHVPLSDHKTALRQAISMDNLGLVTFLIDLGADVNYLTRGSGWLPLHSAVAEHNNLPIIKILLEHGADPTMRSDRDYETPMEMAHRLKRYDVYDLFLKYI